MDINNGDASPRDSALECLALCNGTPDCKFFTWNGLHCWMKTGLGGKGVAEGHVSGSACPPRH